MNYWILETWEKEIIYIGPKGAEQVKQRFLEGRDVDLGNRIIIYKNIKDFRESDRVWSDRKELSTGSSEDIHALPSYTKDGSIVCQWVSKVVPRREWNTYYAPTGYKMLNQTEGQVLIAFRLPIHMIPTTVNICNTDEIYQLEKQMGTYSM